MLPRYGQLGASSRLRSLQFIPSLEAAGISVDVSSLLSDVYVKDVYAGKHSVVSTMRAYMARYRRLLSVKKYDVVWVEKEALPWIPAWLELLALPGSTRLVVDYDDALFHRYDAHRSIVVRLALGGKIDAVMRRANLVTAGNEYLATRARYAGARHIEWLPTVVDLERYPLPECRQPSDEVVVGWIGSPSTAKYLDLVAPVLADLTKKYRLRCIAIGAREDQVANTPFHAVPWTEQSELADLCALDIGIMPLVDDLWERGKCGYKLIQYMACALPVVASPVGVNSHIVDVGENGFLASSLPEWAEAIERLIGDASLRRDFGAAGRRKVEAVYSLQAQAPRLIGFIRNSGNKGKT
jgi:glycosyltransferase involved in cell wall biosynthesis